MRTVGTVRAASAVTALLLAGCTTTGPAARSSPVTPPTAPVTVAPTCPTPTRSAPLPGYDPGPAGNVPAGFEAVAALRCTALPTDRSAPVPVRQERIESGLDALLSVLATPWATTSADICPADFRVTPYLVLVAADGSAIRPAVPLDECGQPRREVLDAIDALPWRTEREAPR